VRRCNATKAIATLLDRGAAVDTPDDLGRTPLHHAAALGRVGAARALRDVGRAFVAAETRDGSTPVRRRAVAREHAFALCVDTVFVRRCC
jgi:ankyrin repeat protein